MAEPTEIAGYLLEKRIGTGGTAAVYAASRAGRQDRFAVKLLRTDLCRDSTLVHRFQREATLLRKIAHPGIVPVVESGCEAGRYFLVMPLVSLPTLQAALEATGPVVVPSGSAGLLQVPVRVLMALDAVHQQGVIHRDLTPRNIFVAPDNQALLADFGIVKILGSESLLTQSGALLGTVPYMAPEQLAEEPVTHRADLYQMGLLLFRIVAGRLPFEMTVSDAVRAKCVAAALPDPRDLGARIPERLAHIIRRATAKKPEDRPASAIEMAAALQTALQAP